MLSLSFQYQSHDKGTKNESNHQTFSLLFYDFLMFRYNQDDQKAKPE